jgi:hypothetical protein
MKDVWEAHWGGKTVRIEVVSAPFFEAFGKNFFGGLFGRAKTRSEMLYGREVMAQREVKESLWGTNPEFDLVGTATCGSGHEAHFHAVITPHLFSINKCQLSIDGEDIPLLKVC